MKKYEVVDVVRQVIVRERRYYVTAISEQDAIRQIVKREAPEGYQGERQMLETSTRVGWRVDGNLIQYEPEQAVPQDNDLVETGGGD